MKADIKAQWVKDLRSGDFQQGRSVLRRDNGEGGKDQFCCLGVLCEQAVKAGVIPAPELHGSTYRYLDDELDFAMKITGESFGQECVLPRKVAEWAGLLHEDGSAREDVIIIPAEDEDSCDYSAIEANDGVGESFATIADLIEKNVSAE